MKTQITYNSKTSPYASTNKEYNLACIAEQELYLNSKLEHRGYIYLNEIYNELGVAWNPDWENLCLRHKPGVRIRLAIRGVNEDGFDIDII